MKLNINNNQETYEIWRVLDFKDIDYRDYIYKKIDSEPNYSFKNDNHPTYLEAAREADRYIEYINYNVNKLKYTFEKIAPYLDELYIIKNTDDIRKYIGNPYFDLRNLVKKKVTKIKNQHLILKNNNKRICNIYNIFFICSIAIISYPLLMLKIKTYFKI